MKYCILLVANLMICTSLPIFGQNDTLKIEDVKFEIIGEQGDTLYNINPSEILIKVTYPKYIKNPKFYNLGFIHFHKNDIPKTAFQISLNSSKKSNPDTIKVNFDSLLPEDKIQLNYFQGQENLVRSYYVKSNLHSNNKPYYLNYLVIYNGDTLNVNDYTILNKEVYKMENNIYYREENPSDTSNICLVKMQNKVTDFRVFGLKKRGAYFTGQRVYQGLVTLHYMNDFDYVKSFKNDDYDDILNTAKELGYQEVKSSKLKDYNTEQSYSLKYESNGIPKEAIEFCSNISEDTPSYLKIDVVNKYLLASKEMTLWNNIKAYNDFILIMDLITKNKAEEYMNDDEYSFYVYCELNIALIYAREGYLRIAKKQARYWNKPKLDYAYFILGQIYQSEYRYKKAIHFYKKCLKLNPDYAKAKDVINSIQELIRRKKLKNF